MTSLATPFGGPPPSRSMPRRGWKEMGCGGRVSERSLACDSVFAATVVTADEEEQEEEDIGGVL